MKLARLRRASCGPTTNIADAGRAPAVRSPRAAARAHVEARGGYTGRRATSPPADRGADHATYARAASRRARGSGRGLRGRSSRARPSRRPQQRPLARTGQPPHPVEPMRKSGPRTSRSRHSGGRSSHPPAPCRPRGGTGTCARRRRPAHGNELATTLRDGTRPGGAALLSQRDARASHLRDPFQACGQWDLWPRPGSPSRIRRSFWALRTSRKILKHPGLFPAAARASSFSLPTLCRAASPLP